MARYRFVFLLAMLLTALVGVSCGQKPMADSVYTVNASKPSFRQPVKAADKKFVRIIVDSITNPAEVAISFELYWVSDGKSQLVGVVSPFPANNPGSFIIATGGKLTGNGELELRLAFPKQWNKKDVVEIKVRPLRLE